MSQSRARRAFYIALARSRSDMLAVAQDVWDRMVAIAESTSEAGVADDTAKRTALSLLQTLARAESPRSLALCTGLCDTFGVLMTRNTVIAAISNLSTAYNLVVINLVQVFVQNQYCGGDHCHDAVVVASTSCLVGAIVGQLCMRYVGACLGRARALEL